MAEIKAKVSEDFGGQWKGFFDPMTAKPNNGTPVGIKPVCCCGYELIKESEDTFRCTGGNHRYRMSEGEVVYDKFGTPLIKLPESMAKKE